jgi:hypothetical protein
MEVASGAQSRCHARAAERDEMIQAVAQLAGDGGS